MILYHAKACSIWWIHAENEISFHISCNTSCVQEYRQIEPSDGNWSFARISFTGSSQMGLLTAVCRINQVCNGPHCSHDKKRSTEPHVGSWRDQWLGVFLSQMPPLENEGFSVIKAFLSGTKCFLELFAFKSEYQWCVGIWICTRNKHVGNWNAE